MNPSTVAVPCLSFSSPSLTFWLFNRLKCSSSSHTYYLSVFVLSFHPLFISLLLCPIITSHDFYHPLYQSISSSPLLFFSFPSPWPRQLLALTLIPFFWFDPILSLLTFTLTLIVLQHLSTSPHLLSFPPYFPPSPSVVLFPSLLLRSSILIKSPLSFSFHQLQAIETIEFVLGMVSNTAS